MTTEKNYWTRRSRMGRRGFMGATGAAGAGLAALALTGCGDDDDNSSTPKPSGSTPAAGSSATAGASTATEQPKKGGVFNYPQTSTLTDVFDPHTSISQAGLFYTVIGNIALRPSVDATKLDPELVEKWEVPGDGTEINLTIRQGVTWHNKPPTNGRAFTTDDLAFNLTRITGKLNPDRLASFQRASTLPNFESATAVDDKTVKVKLTKPHSSFLYGMSDWRNSIIPRDFVEKGGKFEDGASLIGTSPWMIESFQNPVKAVFRPNPNAWEKGMPYLDTLNWVFYGDVLSSQAGFGKGEIDYVPGSEKVVNDTIKKIAPTAREESWAFGNWSHLRMNTTKQLSDPRIRLALFLALPFKNMNDDNYGDKWDWTGPLSPGFPEGIPSAEIAKLPGYNPATKAADIKSAKDSMAAAGFPDGKGLAFKIFYTPTSASLQANAVSAQDAWKSAFPQISVELDPAADGAVFARRQAAGDFDIISYVVFPAADGVIDMSTNYHSTGSRNYGKFADPSIDALLEKASTQLDVKARTETMRSIQTQALTKFMPTIHIANPKQIAYFQPKVKGMTGYASPIGGGSYDTGRNIRKAWLA